MKAVEEVYTVTGTIPKSLPASVSGALHEENKSAGELDRSEDVTGSNLNEGDGKGAVVDNPMSGVEVPHAPETTSPSADRNGKGKEEEKKDEEFDFTKLIDSPNTEPRRSEIIFKNRPPSGRPGWGYHPLEEEFHRLPSQHAHKKRDVFCQWPRHPDGKPFVLSDDASQGKLSRCGFRWSATLYDFFLVNRFVDCPYMTSIMTSSQVLHAIKEAKEWAASDDALKWVLSEPEARDEGIPMAGILLEDRERLVKGRFLNRYSKLDVRKAAEQGVDDLDLQKTKSSTKDEKIAEDPSNWKLDIPISSQFHPSHYPSPWPLIPFSTELDVLQDRIPFYLLPQTLLVHDPSNLLCAVEVREKATSWTSKPDVIHAYQLHLTESTLKGVQGARARAEVLEEFKSHTLIIMRFARSQRQKDNFEPIIEVPLPPYVKRPTKIEESHLYLSPAARVGTGHHSVVYNAEWEVPRNLFVKPKICAECFREALEKEKQRLKDTGRWDRMLKAAGWGPKGFFDAIRTQEDINAEGVNDPAVLEKDGEIIEREVICVVPPGATPMDVLERLEDRGHWDLFLRKKNETAFVIQFTEDEVYPDVPYKEHPPPVLRVNPSFSYRDPSHADTVCPHLLWAPVPRTAKFSVVAKLSIRGDEHLEMEAENYQCFPDHFFEHWSGYTILSQLHAIVPVRAIVPQFYGYYVPKTKEKGRKRYISPILLVEHCGKPINPDELSISDKEECASLLLRFHNSGWLHESVFARNILVQKGSPTLYPVMRVISKDLSFRLIDFGRSRRFIHTGEKGEEERIVLQLFRELVGSMSATLGMF